MTEQIRNRDRTSPALYVSQEPDALNSDIEALTVIQESTSGNGPALNVLTSNTGTPAVVVQTNGPALVVKNSDHKAVYTLGANGLTVIAGVPGTPDAATLPYGRPGSVNTGLAIESSFSGGEDSGSGTDSTGRINLYSYQRAQNGSFGENIRHFLMRRDAKSMDAWYFAVKTDGTLASGYDPTSRDPMPSGIKWTPGAWSGAHWEANDHLSAHMHWELEIPDSTGALQGRIVVPFGNTTTQVFGLDKTNIGINQADLTMHSATGGVIRIAGSTSFTKDLEFSLDSDGGDASRRWKLRADAVAESGSNAGTNLGIFRYADDGTINSIPAFKIVRSNGNVGINKATPVATLDVTGTLAASGNALGQFTPASHAMLAWSYDPALIVNSHATSNGNVYWIKMPIAADGTISNILYYVSVVATTPVTSQNFAALYSSSGALITSADIGSGTTSTGLKTVAITPQAVTAGSFVWVALLFNAATAPNIGRMGGTANIASVVNAGLLTSQSRYAIASTSQTTLPSSITPSGISLGNPIWAAVS